MLVSYARYQSAYQRFKNDTILNTSSSTFCPAWRYWENDRTNHLMSFFFLLTLSKHLPCIFLSISCSWRPFCYCQQTKLWPNKKMAWQVELDWHWKLFALQVSKQNLRNLYYGLVRQLCGTIGEDNVQSSLSIRLLTSLNRAQNLECCTHFGLLTVLCTTPVLQPSFLRIRRTIFQRHFSVKSHLKYLRNYKSRKLSFACISSLMVLKVLGITLCTIWDCLTCSSLIHMLSLFIFMTCT